MLSLVRAIWRKVQPYEKYARKAGVKIGQGCLIETRDFGSEPYLIEIGNHVRVTRGVHFVTHDGAVWVGREKERDFTVYGRIKVGDNTYIGNYSLILPGVEIGSNCVIGAGSIVTKSIPDGSVVAGNPARYICSTQSYLERMTPLDSRLKSASGGDRRVRLLSGTLPLVRKQLMKPERPGGRG